MDVRLLLLAAVPFAAPGVGAVEVGVRSHRIRDTYVPGTGWDKESEATVTGAAVVGVFDLEPILP